MFTDAAHGMACGLSLSLQRLEHCVAGVGSASSWAPELRAAGGHVCSSGCTDRQQHNSGSRAGQLPPGPGRLGGAGSIATLWQVIRSAAPVMGQHKPP